VSAGFGFAMIAFDRNAITLLQRERVELPIGSPSRRAAVGVI
jgi:hypothetical protein